MRLRCKKGSYEYIDRSPICISDPSEHRGGWSTVFGNDHPIHLEIGTGKGAFLTELAVRNPEINYIGMELYANPLYRAVVKGESLGCDNIRFLRMDAEFLQDVFSDNELDAIYLNFSDPWPKYSKENKRLTSAHFLDKYSSVLSNDGRVEFKTDDLKLFEFSLKTAEESGWRCSQVTYDLHGNGNPEWNVMTDYEMKFVSEGVRINRVVLTPPVTSERE